MNAKKILLVDDDPAARALPGLLLRKWGYEVLEAHDGAEALRILRDQRIGMVISDWMMPNLNGIELCRKIREQPPEHYIYLILCTARGEKSDLIEGMEAGADDFLVKPISKEELRVRVRAGDRVLDLERGLAERNRKLQQTNEQLEKAYARIEGDLKAAAWMQVNLLPPPSPSALSVASEWCFRPSCYVAGDTFNIFPIDDCWIGFYLLDVSGHGVPAAMLSVTLSMVLNPESAHANPFRRLNPRTGAYDMVPPPKLVEDLNRRFQTRDDHYFTMIYGQLHSRTGELVLTQAGHPNPIVIQNGNETRTLGEGGVPVGLWPNAEYEAISTRLYPGDRLVLYSDGITECATDRGELFGEKRLLDYLTALGTIPLREMVFGVEHAMEEWRGGPTFEDDVSLLALEFTAGS